MAVKLKLTDLKNKDELVDKVVVSRTFNHDATGLTAELKLEESAAFNAFLNNTYQPGIYEVTKPKTLAEMRNAVYTDNDPTFSDYIMNMIGDFILQSWNITDEKGDAVPANWQGLETVFACAKDNEGMSDAIAMLSDEATAVLNEYRQAILERDNRAAEIKKKPSRSTRTNKKQTS